MTLLAYLATLSVSYFFLVNSAFLLLIVAAVFALTRYSRSRTVTASLVERGSSVAPSISILAPAFNEQESIVDSVSSFLALNYPSFEVIVINDGSKDQTLNRLIEAYALVPTEYIFEDTLSKTRVRGIYTTKLHPNLVVVDKENGGKADALNVGIGVSRHGIFCAVDSDSLLDADSLLKVAMPFMENPGRVVASGGTVRIANGTRVKNGRVEEVTLPRNLLVVMQIVEYTRAFLCGRIGWNAMNSTLVISGAFGVFSKMAVRAIGGYTPGCIGEDMELILRLHKHHLRAKKPYAIVFVPDPVCWTEAPADLGTLGRQRDRWQRGLADTLLRNRDMIFNPRYGVVGLIALPYFLFVELLGPVLELGALAVLGLALFAGGLDTELLWIFFVASLLYGAILSISALLIEEVYFSNYTRVRQFMALFLVCLIESIWFRQISTYWRLKGLVKFARGDHSWGQMQRLGFRARR